MNNQPVWSKVDALVEATLLQNEQMYAEIVKANNAAGLPAIDVSPAQGKMLQLFARMCGAQSILEIGTLGGYSTAWLANALPTNGRLVSLEYDPYHAKIAQENIDRAGLSAKVEIRIGAAADNLPVLEREGAGPFDLIFIDADKPNNRTYLEWAIKLSRPGTVLICDNVVFDGGVVNPNSSDVNVQGARDVFEFFSQSPRVSATAIQTVGSKGYDGFAVAIVD